ncbi:MAG: ATP synthase F1 subunit gamma [Chthoniobacterales bacterium]|nr:ATP synthase F1 subunit gamma [Chthoniobacterales bacterium]
MGSNTRDIRRRIKSVKNTAQITKAMQMIAAAKMRKAQQRAMDARPYAQMLNRVLVSLHEHTEDELHPLLQARPVHHTLVYLVGTDKGLCGGLNTNLFREVQQFDPATTSFIATGRKAVDFLARTKRQLLADFPMRDTPDYSEVKPVAQFIIDKFLAGEADKVVVLHTDFVNTLTQVPSAHELLPITAFHMGGKKAEEEESSAEEAMSSFKFEPSPKEVLSALLPFYVGNEIYAMILNARASEQSARMVAMKNATDNAKSLIKDLTLEYNKIRQAAITTEILEISTAQIAMG